MIAPHTNTIRHRVMLAMGDVGGSIENTLRDDSVSAVVAAAAGVQADDVREVLRSSLPGPASCATQLARENRCDAVLDQILAMPVVEPVGPPMGTLADGVVEWWVPEAANPEFFLPEGVGRRAQVAEVSAAARGGR
jgi:hypothetical protein